MAFHLIIRAIFSVHALSEIPLDQIKSRRAVSPVIATVILVAIGVVLATALASYSQSIFNVNSQVPQVKIVNATFSNSAKTVTIYFTNTGPVSDKVSSVTVPVGATTLSASGANLNPNPANLPPNSTTKIVATFSGTMPSIGQQVAVTTASASGQQYVISIQVLT